MAATTIEYAHPDVTTSLKVADAVWVATALLHKEHSQCKSFTREEIAEKTRSLKLTAADYKSIWRHVDHHCVANREPVPNRPRILWDMGQGQRRLYKDGDPYSTARKGSPTHPVWESLPLQFSTLRDWYEQEWNSNPEDPLLALIGSGKEIWSDEPTDEYINRLRREW